MCLSQMYKFVLCSLKIDFSKARKKFVFFLYEKVTSSKYMWKALTAAVSDRIWHSNYLYSHM